MEVERDCYRCKKAVRVNNRVLIDGRFVGKGCFKDLTYLKKLKATYSEFNYVCNKLSCVECGKSLFCPLKNLVECSLYQVDMFDGN